jgi:capsular polysaccharide biosynthesis protein
MSYYFFYEVTTKDDMYFYNKKAIPDCLAINSFLKYKDDDIFLNELYDSIPSKEIKKINNLYLFIFNRGLKSGGNYYHFIYHYLQKILGYFEIENLNIGIPINMLEFQKEIISKMIPKNKIIYLDIYRYNYKITKCYVGKYFCSSKLPDQLFNKYQNLFLINNFENKNIICILRKNLNNAGRNRIMVNQQNFLNYLKKFNTNFLYFEDYNLSDKIKNLCSLCPKIIIMEIGSGLVNLLFIKKKYLKNIKFIIIDQSEWKFNNSRILNIFNLLDLNYDIFTCNTIYKNDESDKKNNPFEININEFESKYNKLLSN